MRTRSGHPLRRPALAGLCALALALTGAACGEQDSPATSPSAPSPDTPTSSPPAEPPPNAGGDLPELPDNDDPSAVICTAPPEGTFDATSIVGETEEDAAAAAEAEGCSLRVVERDGRGLAVTEDFSPSRVNVAVADGVVEEIVSLG
jgi:hypothetical protein